MFFKSKSKRQAELNQAKQVARLPSSTPEKAGAGALEGETPIINAQNLRKIYRTGPVEVEVLKGVNFQVERGEMVAIMGPSGCGKTTLLNCLSGLDSIDGGDVKIAGRSLPVMNDNERTDYRANHMGFIFQSFNLLPVLNAVENVELPLLMARVKPNEARKRAIRALESVGLADRITHRPSELSGGQQQRVTIARALINNPAIVWADEPTGNLDSDGANTILDLIQKLNQENRQTFVIVTHAPDIGARAGRLIRMRDGKIVSDICQLPNRPWQTDGIGNRLSNSLDGQLSSIWEA